MQKKGYYAYFDEKKQKYYYLDATLGTTTWNYPVNGIVLDPKTRKRFPNPNENFPDQIESKARLDRTSSFERKQSGLSFRQDPSSKREPLVTFEQHQRKNSVMRLPTNNLIIHVDPAVQSFVPPTTKKRSQTFSPKQKNLFTARDTDEPRYLPKSISDGIHQFIFRDFAQKYFAKQKERRVFRRTTVSIESLISFQSKPLSAPLLESLPKPYKNDAIKCFNYILSFTGANNKPNPNAADELVQLLYTKEPLIDEVYFQMMKQLQQNPKYDCLVLTYKLFLIIATIFPSTLNSETWIKSFLLQKINDFDPTISEIAQFIFIRFHGRCCVGKPLVGMLLPQILAVPEQMNSCNKVFDVSLYEIMWDQRKKYPKLPIPLVLYQMVDLLIKKGCDNHLGIFRISGNAKRIDTLVEIINNGGSIPENERMDDLASLMKQWVRNLSDPIVPFSMFDKLATVNNDGYMDFANSLPECHRATLAYIIGFLQWLSQFEENTKMTSANLAIVFAPSITQTKDLLMYGGKLKEIGQNFLTYLMNNWDVSNIYPLKKQLYDLQ
ncbi:RhoGAP domain containing protein [Histomonas meleagridis]|uniref:RhoGAP domain containing protein n=1 Tax=Histomonas meleagridis TaxID=135588 RepID=UPI00355AADAE|nr:RhoGAP domain containing protein [Histomonas meleagridis]KAH0800656.1 RhoGAP domain containing protein [Histomonas meleagridis]